jgi:hypothetical protein
MEEVEYFLKELFDSYITMKKLTSKKFEVKYTDEYGKHVDMTFDNHCKIHISPVENCLNITFYTEPTERDFLREIHKVVSGFAHFIDNQELISVDKYYFQLRWSSKIEVNMFFNDLVDQFRDQWEKWSFKTEFR